MTKNEGIQKLNFFKPSDLAWNAPYKSQGFKGMYDFMLGHNHSSAGTRAARGPRVDSPVLDQVC